MNMQRLLWVLLAFTLLPCSPLWAQRLRWEPTNGPYAAFEFALRLASNDSTLFAGTNGGVYRSTDNGGTWEKVFVNSSNHYVYSLLLNRGVLLAALVNSGGIIRSTDNGTTWTIVLPTSSASNVTDLLAVDSTTVLAATFDDGAFRSTDNGITWEEINSGLAGDLYAMAVHDTTFFAASKSGGVFRSTNRGGTWKQEVTGLKDLNVRCLAVLGSSLFAGTESGTVYRSINWGETWMDASSGLNAGYVNALMVDGPLVFASTDSGLFRSSDKGADWKRLNISTMAGGVGRPIVQGGSMIVMDAPGRQRWAACRAQTSAP